MVCAVSTDPRHSAGGEADGVVQLTAEVTDIGNLIYFVYKR